MAKARAGSKADVPDDPNKLVRQQAGTYRTGDERFEVREADVGWFLVDSEQTNEFGQELIQGPFATLKAIREVLPEKRATAKAAPGRKRSSPSRKRAAKPAPEPEPPPPSWIDQLPRADAAAVRRLIGALEREGIDGAEALVRRDRDGLLAAVAARLIERRLEALVGELPAEGRDAARAFVHRVANVLGAEGKPRDPLPGWTLVEVGPGAEPPNRRIDLRS